MNDEINFNELEEFIKTYKAIFDKRFKNNTKNNNVNEIDAKIHAEVLMTKIESDILNNIENESNKEAYLNNWISLLKLAKLKLDQEKVYANAQTNTTSLLYTQIILLIEKLEVYKDFDYAVLNKSSFNSSVSKMFIKSELEKMQNLNFRNTTEFEMAISYLFSFFERKNKTIRVQIPVTGVVLKEFCSSLGNIWREIVGGKISDEYIIFCVKLFTIFNKCDFTKTSTLDNLKSYFRITAYRK